MFIQIFSVDNTIYIFWIDLIIGIDDIYFKRSPDDGAIFGDTINLSNNDGDSYIYQVNISTNDTMYVVWQDETQGVNGTSDVLFRRCTDGGAIFGDIINLSNTIEYSTGPDLASSNEGRVFAVRKDETNGKKQVFFTPVT